MKNLELAKLFRTIANMLEMQKVPWKPHAYRTAAQSIESLSEDIADIAQRGELQKIPGIGEHIAVKIEEFLKTGTLQYYQKLKKEVKVDVESLLSIPHLGPQKMKQLYAKLGVKNVKDLEKALAKGKVRQLPGFGAKTEQILVEGIDIVKKRPHRFLYIHAQPVVEKITKALQKVAAVQQIEVAGSFRRGKETVGDLDFLVVSSKPEQVMKAFTSLPEVTKVIARGITKSSVLLDYNLQIDLRVVTEKEFGSALLYFIGNKEHNIELRKIALQKGYTLSEYGLFTIKGKKWIAGRTEQEVYTKLGLPYIEPELRENRGEIAAAYTKKLPMLLKVNNIQGMFHNHTTWTDGNNTLLEMAQKAEELKWKFISFNDHYGPIGITNPLNEKRLPQYLKEIDKVQKKVSIRVFSGVEIDILKDGSLPLSSSKLKQLDVVVASVH
ncbi:MAG: helix-hairpin-helix domain-containing protein, partial [Nanoarchaeota archaeon]|nr:helix-hairpin-helix domain-containing protein [Nanoarchaeota archaeon]